MRSCVLIALIVVVMCLMPSLAQTGLPVVPAAQELQHPPQPQPLSAFEQQVVEAQKAFLAAVDRGDVGYVKNVVADDFASIATNGDMESKRELVDSVKPSNQQGPAPVLYDFRVVTLSDSAAIVTYKIASPTGGLERYQHLSDTWVKQGNDWKLKFKQTTLNLWSAHDL